MTQQWPLQFHLVPGTLELHDAELATQSSDQLHPMNLKPRRVLVELRDILVAVGGRGQLQSDQSVQMFWTC